MNELKTIKQEKVRKTVKGYVIIADKVLLIKSDRTVLQFKSVTALRKYFSK